MSADAAVVDLLPIVAGLNECVGAAAAGAMVSAAKSTATSPDQLVELLRVTLDQVRAREKRPTLATSSTMPSPTPVIEEGDDEGDDGADRPASEPEPQLQRVADLLPTLVPATRLHSIDRVSLPGKFRDAWRALLRRASQRDDRTVTVTLASLARGARITRVGAGAALRFLAAGGAVIIIEAPKVVRDRNGRVRTTPGQYRIPALDTLDQAALVARIRALPPEMRLADRAQAARRRRYRASRKDAAGTAPTEGGTSAPTEGGTYRSGGDTVTDGGTHIRNLLKHALK